MLFSMQNRVSALIPLWTHVSWYDSMDAGHAGCYCVSVRPWHQLIIVSTINCVTTEPSWPESCPNHQHNISHDYHDCYRHHHNYLQNRYPTITSLVAVPNRISSSESESDDSDSLLMRSRFLFFLFFFFFVFFFFFLLFFFFFVFFFWLVLASFMRA